ncbi:MAG: DUF4276 family protein [Gammaproteobacteria bacterium]|nr:DUF4276 family protein [Gammaproteobacteria bacterium]MDE0366798.1 DUF4276 family protein [Gammaproteobacteria bacterium]
MIVRQLEVLVEERSMEEFLRTWLQHVIPNACAVRIHAFRGKRDLLKQLSNRLRGYAKWLPPEARIVVVVDRDNDDCRELKARLETEAANSGLKTRSMAGGSVWQLANRIAIEELEAWYFGDWAAVQTAYPRVQANVSRKAKFRDPDAIRGGTWEAFERILQRSGYFKTGLRKVEAARAIACHVNPVRNRSRSFRNLHQAIIEAAS